MNNPIPSRKHRNRFIIFCRQTFVWGLLAGFLLAAPTMPTTAAAEEVEHTTGFYYTIKKGDTLWDLSRNFSDDPFRWPHLWKDNRQIRNPHRIFPGERIRIYGERETADVSPNLTPLPSDPSGLLADDAAQATPPAEEPETFYYAGIQSAGFIRKQRVAAKGEIFETESGKLLIGANDVVYIRPENEGDLITGSRYVCYRILEPNNDRKMKNIYGFQYYLTGEIEITRVESGYAVANIVQSYREIKMGDQIMPYVERDTRIPVQAARPDLEGKLIVSEEHTEMFGENDVAFIDKGTADGLQAGQSYTIYRQKKATRGSIVGTYPKITLGSFIVLQAEAETATVLITDSKESIPPNCRFYSLSE